MCQNPRGVGKVDIMDFAWEFIAVWKNQYFAMIRIQFPEFFRSAVFFLNGFISHLFLQRAHRLIDIPRKYFPDEQQNKDMIECEVLYEPSPEEHLADIIIIHGLHGSTYKTWRQGVYKCDEVQKVQLRKHIPLAPNVEDNKTCTKCSVSKNEQPACDKLNSGNKFLDRNLNDVEYYSDPIETMKNTSKYGLEVVDDNVYFNNIDLIRSSFQNSINPSEKLKDITEDNSERNRIENNEYCNCEIRCGSWPLTRNCDDSFLPENICDDINLEFRESFKYSCTISNNCRKCKKKPTSHLPENIQKNKDCFISYSFKNMSDDIFAFDEAYYNSASYEYTNSYTETNIFQENFQTEVRRQSLKVIDENTDDSNVKMLNNFISSIGDQQSYENRNYCECITKSSREEISFGYYLKYEDIYGSSPKLLKQVVFLFRFFMSFAKETYSLLLKLWHYSNGSEQLSSCWPRDWLPIDCPYARVISINYTTFLWSPIWNKNCQRMSLQEKSLEMAKQLEILGVGKKPIVWAAHSKGGLFVKQMFINSCHEHEGVSRDIFENTQSMVFYSVPQHGSILAHFFTSPFVTPSVEIMEIRTGSQMLRKLQNEFQEALKTSKENRLNSGLPTIVSYTETIPTNMSGVLLQIVFPTSADPGVGELYGIPLDHRMICKFASRESVLYRDLVELVEKTCKIFIR